MMLKKLGIALLSAAALAMTGLVSAPAAGAATNPVPRTLVTFPTSDWGEFAESAVMDRDGTLYVSVTTWTAEGSNRGQVWRITKQGQVSLFGPAIDVGILTGLALDDEGRLYAGLFDWDDPSIPPGVLHIDARSVTRVLTLPGGTWGEASMPNGLAFRGGDLYVSDSAHGAIWKTHPRGARNDVQTTPWFQDPVLAPTVGFGINGIVVDRHGIDAVVSDTGTVVRIPMNAAGRPGAVRVVVSDPSLVSADGLTRGPDGALWISVNYLDGQSSGAIARVDGRGSLRVVLSGDWLAYPTQPLFGTTASTATTLYVANGGLDVPGTANVVALKNLLPRVG